MERQKEARKAEQASSVNAGVVVRLGTDEQNAQQKKAKDSGVKVKAEKIEENVGAIHGGVVKDGQTGGTPLTRSKRVWAQRRKRISQCCL